MNKASNCFSTSRSPADAAQEIEEKECEAYARKHNLFALFSDFATALKEKNPSTEQDAEHVLFDLLSHRKAERDRAALRLRYQQSFEVNFDNGRKTLKLVLTQDGGTLTVFAKAKTQMSLSFPLTIEEIEELNKRLYELGRFIVESSKGSGETRGFVRVDEGDVYFLASTKESVEIGDELFHFCFFLSGKKTLPKEESA